jgi:hypothetical protein
VRYDKVCLDCGVALTEDNSWPSYIRSSHYVCKECSKKRDEIKRKDRLPYFSEYNKTIFYPKHREEVLARSKQWRLDNPEKRREYSATYRASKLQRTPLWVDRKELAKVYALCPDGYHVDHIIPLQGELVSGFHVPANLQYLTPEENSIKGNSFDPEEFMKSLKYLKWVASLPCIHCGAESQAHHLRVGQLGAGMGKKASDFFTIPVCFQCHAGCHDTTFDKTTQMRWCLETIYKALREGVLSYDNRRKA